MTKPVCSLVIDIVNATEYTLSAASWSDEGHLWAIERRPISLTQLRAAAKALGPDAIEGVENRLSAERQRLVERLEQAEYAVKRVEKAREDLAKFDSQIGERL
jgi:hypothetical protein